MSAALACQPTPEDFAFSDLISYAAFQWPRYADAPHHRLIARHLEAVERGEIKRLMITMPPRHGKSMLASEFFPAWYIGRNPEHYVVTATYAQELADDFGRKVKNQIEDEAYNAIFPGVGLAGDSKSAKRFHIEGRSGGFEHQTTQRGAFYAVGVGGPLTGRGAHCFVAGTIVETSDGPKQIELLKDCPPSCKILSFNHDTGQFEYRAMQAFSEREGFGIYRITTASGRMVEATGDHRIFTDKGYVEARSLAAGDRLLCALRQGQNEDCIRISEVGSEVSARSLLLADVQSGACCLQGPQALREVRGEDASKDYAVLPSVQAEAGKESGAPTNKGILSNLLDTIYGRLAGRRKVRHLLRQDVCGHRPFCKDVGQGESQVETWGHAAARTASFGKGLPCHEAVSEGARWESVRHLPRDGKATCAPHRQLADEQLVIQSSDSLSVLSQGGAPLSGWKAGDDYVIKVERVRESAPVFDIQVQKNHNFFANGMLVHNCLLIDDPIKNREEADSEVMRRKTRDWYTSTAYTRLMPGGRIVIIQCMVGDTSVMLPDGTSKALRDIRPGDKIATYENGEITSSFVRNHVNNGPDRVYAITTKSGITVRANARHPFLVNEGGKAKWIRTRDLRPGQEIYRVSGASGAGKFADRTGAINQSVAEDIARPITTKSGGQTVFARLRSIRDLAAKRICAIATGLTSQITNDFLPNKVALAPSVASLPRSATHALTGTGSCVSTTATTASMFAGFSATTATSQSGMERLSKSSAQPPTTFGIEHDEILEIVSSGVEDVYDIEVERTANFIANGLVSHNTRWHEDDLSGWLLREHEHEDWTVLDLPAINDSGEALWPDQYSLEALEGIRRALPPRDWSALYQQRPAPDTGDYFKREWIHEMDSIPSASTMQVFGASDYAVTADGGDFTVHVVMGIDHTGRLWLLDLWRKQSSSDEWVDSLCGLVRQWKPIGWAEETGQIKSGVGPFLVKRMLETQSYVAREQFPTRGDKAVRAQSIRGRMAMQGLHVKRGAPWLPSLISEMMSFPVGSHDDQVDALGLAGQLIAKMDFGKTPEADKPKPGAPPRVVADGVIAPPLGMRR